MSTKIYNVFKINKNLNETFLFLENLKLEVKQELKEIVYESSAGLISELYDDLKFRNSGYITLELKKEFEKNTEMTFFQYILKFINYCAKDSYEEYGGRLPEGFDINVSCVVIPFNNSETLIKFFHNNSKINKFLMKKLNELSPTDYSYYDNTDEPEDLEENEWDNRKKFWDNLIEKNGLRFKDFGFIYEMGLEDYSFGWLSDEERNYLKEKIIGCVPNLKESRIKEESHNLFYDNYKKLKNDNGNDNEKEDFFTDSEIYYEFKKYIKSEDGKKEFELYKLNMEKEIDELDISIFDKKILIDNDLTIKNLK